MNWKRGLGIGLVFIGLFVILTSRVITGAVIGFKPYNYLGLLGVLVFIIGVFFIVISKVGGLEKEVVKENISVYESERRGIKRDERIFMTDPYHFFSVEGKINLKDLREMYEIIERDEELLKEVREVYGKRLHDIVENKTEEDAGIAKEFLRVIYGGEIPKSSQYCLSKEEKDRIKNAFRVGWKLNFNAVQRKVLRDYDLDYRKTSGNHLKVYSKTNPNLNTDTSSTPSDFRTGRNFSNEVIKIIETVGRSGEYKA